MQYLHTFVFISKLNIHYKKGVNSDIFLKQLIISSCNNIDITYRHNMEKTLKL